MKITITGQKASSILYDGKFFDTNKPLDLSFSEAFRLSRVATVNAMYDQVDYDPSIWRDQKLINFFGDMDMTSGFGGVSYNLVKFAYPNIKTMLAGKTLGVRDPLIFAGQQRELDQRGAMVWHDQPREQWLYSPFKRNIAIVPFETTRIPRSWIAKINNFDALLVPCEQNRQAFRDSGVKVPIELIHWGVDPEKYYPIERPEREVFTFGTMGALSIRKGTDVLIDAFREAFPTEKDVRLIAKTSYNNYPFMVPDKRIEVQMTPVTHEELMRDFFKQVDCFVFPTRGEGFGLTPLEAMATGLPAIVTGWSGPLEYMTPETGWLIQHSFSPAKNFSETIYKEDCGEWAEPNKEHLKMLMRHAYENRAETRAKGKAAAEHVQKNWLWSQKIKMYENALEMFL